MSFGIMDALVSVDTKELLKRCVVSRVHSSMTGDDVAITGKKTREETEAIAADRRLAMYRYLHSRGVAQLTFGEVHEACNPDMHPRVTIRDLHALRREGRVAYTASQGKGYYWAREELCI
mgnify:CR=1 FL=1